MRQCGALIRDLPFAVAAPNAERQRHCGNEERDDNPGVKTQLVRRAD
jgi:hypothetical protein